MRGSIGIQPKAESKRMDCSIEVGDRRNCLCGRMPKTGGQVRSPCTQHYNRSATVLKGVDQRLGSVPRGIVELKYESSGIVVGQRQGAVTELGRGRSFYGQKTGFLELERGLPSDRQT